MYDICVSTRSNVLFIYEHHDSLRMKELLMIMIIIMRIGHQRCFA